MANNKNKASELVADDDDATAELEIPTFRHDRDVDQLESDADTFDFTELQSDLQERSETIERLQFDIEQLRARWLGLETEIQAREEITKNLHEELDKTKADLGRKKSLIKKRDASIKALKSEIRQRDDDHRQLADSLEDVKQQLLDRDEELAQARSSIEQREQSLADLRSKADGLQEELSTFSKEEIEQNQHEISRQSAQITGDADQIRELQAQLMRTEEYADSIRQQFSDLLNSTENHELENTQLQAALDEATALAMELEAANSASQLTIGQLSAALDKQDAAHADEIRILRFELSEAEETFSNSEQLSAQLASDLIDTKANKEELERVLSEREEHSKSEIETLQKEVEKLRVAADDYEQELETKSEAINCLMQEIANKSEQLESIHEIEEVIHDIDDRMSERIELQAPKDRDRVTRLLIGKLDDQLLRFPLFKDRLTIGRTSENDIQLKAQYISRRHAVVLTEGDRTRVIDWGSKNGVFVNKKRVSEYFLENGDIVTIGTADFRYEERAKRD